MSNQMTSLFLCISWKVVVVRPLRRWCLLSHKFLIYPTSTTTFLLCYQLIWYSEVMVSWVLDPIIKVEGSEDFPPTSPIRFALLQPSEFQKILIKFWFAFIWSNSSQMQCQLLISSIFYVPDEFPTFVGNVGI